nr:hypothetical protein [Candidatus Njordarchaeum guaymaensis]
MNEHVSALGERKIIGFTTPSEMNPATITQESMRVVANFALDAGICLGTDVIIGLYSTEGEKYDIRCKVAARIVEHGLQPPPGVKDQQFAGYRDLKPLISNWSRNIRNIIPELFQTCTLKLIGVVDEQSQTLLPIINPLPYGCPIVLPTKNEMRIIYAFREEGWTIGALVQGMEVVKFKDDESEKVFAYLLDPYAIFRSVAVFGGPGSGKTVLAKTLTESAYDWEWVVNAPDFKDEMAQMLFEADPAKLGFAKEDIRFWEELGLSPLRISNCKIYYLPSYAPNFTYLRQEGYDINELGKYLSPFSIRWDLVPPRLAALYMPNPSEQAVAFFPQVLNAFRDWARENHVEPTLNGMLEWTRSDTGRHIMLDVLRLWMGTVDSILRNLLAMDESEIFDRPDTTDFIEKEVMRPPRLNIISVSRVPFDFRMIFQLHWLLKSLDFKSRTPGEPYLMQILDEAHYMVPRKPQPGYQELLVRTVNETMRVFRAAGAGLVLVSHSPEDFNETADSMIGTKIFGNLEETAIKAQARDLQEFASRISQLPPGYFVVRSPPNVTNIAAPKCHLVKTPRCRTTHIESEILFRKALARKRAKN